MNRLFAVLALVLAFSSTSHAIWLGDGVPITDAGDLAKSNAATVRLPAAAIANVMTNGPLIISYTGEFQYQPVWEASYRVLVPPFTTGGTGAVCTASDLIGLDILQYGEGNGGSRKLTSISFDNLQFIAGDNGFSFQCSTACTNYNFPELLYVGDCCTFTLNGAGAVSFPKLKFLGGTTYFNGSSTTFKTFSLPALEAVDGVLYGPQCASVTNVSYASLKYAKGIYAAGNAGTTTFDAPGVIWVDGIMDLGTVTPNLANVTLGAVGTTKMITSSVTVTACKLTAQSIENILTVLASLNGSNGTVAWAATVNVSGGTNAGYESWSTAAKNAKDTIVARGGTVIHNGGIE
jgi:hypothetical protein